MCSIKKKSQKHLGIFIDRELHYKPHSIAKYEGRSASGEMLYLLRKCMREFEEQDGTIPLPDDQDEGERMPWADKTTPKGEIDTDQQSQS